MTNTKTVKTVRVTVKRITHKRATHKRIEASVGVYTIHTGSCSQSGAQRTYTLSGSFAEARFHALNAPDYGIAGRYVELTIDGRYVVDITVLPEYSGSWYVLATDNTAWHSDGLAGITVYTGEHAERDARAHVERVSPGLAPGRGVLARPESTYEADRSHATHTP